MGRMLEALKQLEDRSALSDPVAPAAAEEPAAMEEMVSTERSVAAAARDELDVCDPRYRDLLGAILSQLAVRRDAVLLVAGFAGEQPRGGQLATLYPLLAKHVDGGLLVVDADLSSASLAERFDVCCKLGLDDVLTRHVPWQDVARQTKHAGLYLLPGTRTGDAKPFAGNGRKSVSHKRPVPTFFPLLTELRRAHRLVLIDTVLSTPRAMGAWAAICDAAVLAVRLEVTPRHQVRRAIRAIWDRGGQVLGCVLLEP